MKLETFFEKFDQFADAPDAVARMRELVLKLAVQGKLVPQDPNDEPASILLERVRDARRRLADKGSLKTKVHIPEVEADDQLYAIPKTWLWVPLNELTELVYGKLLPTSDLLPTGFPVFGANGIIGCFSKYLYEDEMLLISCRGAYSGTPNISPPKCYVTNNSIVCEFFEPKACDIRFYQAVISVSPRERIVTGSAQPQVTVANAIKLPVPLPPLAEQKRIVAKVDELMTLCDRLEAQQQECEEKHAALARASLSRFADAPTPENLSFIFHPSYTIPPADLRKSILTLAVQGKLVSQDPNDEPAARVLERIDAAPKRAMKTRVAEEDEGGEPTELEPLFELPPGWEWAPFRRLPLQASVGIDRGRSMQGPDKAIGYFKMNNIRNSGGVDLSDLTRIDATPDEVEAFALADGDFLFNTRNSRELVGKTCVFRAPSDEPILYNNNILRVRFIEGFSPDFLDYWFRSPEGSAELEKLKSNTTNVCAIYQGKLSGFPCVVPPLAEQRRIVAKVEQLMALVDELETQLAAARTAAANLLSAIVAELTAQEVIQ